MRICIVTPSRLGRPQGNSVTAERWADILSGLGHHVDLVSEYHEQPADLLVALHARRSASSVEEFGRLNPSAAVVVALTGTDLYPQLGETDRPALEVADRLVVLQPLAMRQIPEDLRHKTEVIFQSAIPLPAAAKPSNGFEALLLANLRPVKGPLLAARAARRLPATSSVQIRHAGAVLDQRLARIIEREGRAHHRYEWLGELSRIEAQRRLAGCNVLLVTSRHEGGANVVSEALATGVPVIATRIPGNVGILGDNYPGYFEVGDARHLAALLARVEADDDLHDELKQWCAKLRPLVSRERERDCWERLLAALSDRCGS
jgi:putative glycosyltransferase (TIGR04348 family)